MRCMGKTLQGGVGQSGTDVLVVSSLLLLEEGHNKIKECLQCLQSEFEMTSINAKGERELSPQQLTHVIQSYLGAALFKQAVHYETLTQAHAPYLDFAYHQVPLQTNLPTKQEKYIFPELFKDVQTKLVLNMHIVRIVQYGHYLMCLAFDTSPTMGEQRFFILAIVFEDDAQAKAWRLEYSFLTQVKVAEPFRTTHKISMHHDTHLLVTRPQNIKIQTKFKLVQQNAEEVRIQGNTKFKEKKFIEALLEYQFGLGLTQLPENKRERAILYANSSQCLFEMRLFQAALTYAGISASLDKTYAKGIYRKFMCLLQLKQLREVPMALRGMSEICAPSEYQLAEQISYRHHLHNQGIFDWKEIFSGSSLNFGEYFSPKLKQIKDETMQVTSLQPFKWSYQSKQRIQQYQLILFCKPLIYKNAVQSKFGQNYTSLIKEILTYCDYQDHFFEKFQELPSQCQVQGHTLKFNCNLENIEMNQIHAKCLRCLELQKLMKGGEGQECLGIWQELYRFKQECMPNCTYVHIKGGLALFAVRDIEEGETLTIDFLNSQTQQRSAYMQEKLGVSCECPFCQWAWEEDREGRSAELLYAFYRQSEGEWTEEGYQKMSLFYLWNLIFVKSYKEMQLMKEYLSLLQRYPLWECLINCLKYLRLRDKNDLFDLIKTTIKRAFQKYFRLTHPQAVELLKAVL